MVEVGWDGRGWKWNWNLEGQVRLIHTHITCICICIGRRLGYSASVWEGHLSMDHHASWANGHTNEIETKYHRHNNNIYTHGMKHFLTSNKGYHFLFGIYTGRRTSCIYLFLFGLEAGGFVGRRTGSLSISFCLTFLYI